MTTSFTSNPSTLRTDTPIRNVPAEPVDNRIRLYDWYGSLAYGVILSIIPQPEAAQQILIDLFQSDQLPNWTERAAGQAAVIIRLARQRALMAKPAPTGTELTDNRLIPKENLPKLIFELTFRRGYQPGVVAEQLQMTYADVLQAIRTYVHSFRPR